MSSEFNYSPPPSLAQLFIEPKFYNIVIGPIGSTKTTACIFFLLVRAMQQKPGKDGVARTRFAICRNTLVALRLTVLRDILKLLGPLVKWRPSENTIRMELPADPKQGRPKIESEWFFLPLENLEDQRRLLSLQLSGVYVNECREVPLDLITACAGRVDRFPSVADGGVSHPFILGDTNPPALGSDLWEFVERKKPPNLLFIHQCGAFDPAADWKQFLSPTYYENLIGGYSQEWVDVHVHGQYGNDPSGQAVFGRTFDILRHTYRPTRDPEEIAKGATTSTFMPVGPEPLIVGMDPGLNPAAVVTQMHVTGQLRVLRECYGIGCSTEEFIRDSLEPMLLAPELQNHVVVLVMDPAGMQRNANAEQTAYGILSRRFNTRIAGTNAIQPRINAVDTYLCGVAQAGAPKLLIDAGYCPLVVAGLDGAYRYKRKTDGQIDPTPMKEHPTSDLIDALGYACLGHMSPAVIGNLRHMGRGTPRERPAPRSALGWT